QEDRRTLELKRCVDQCVGRERENCKERFMDKFEVKQIIGLGPYGSVFKGINKLDNWEYAVKRIAVDSKFSRYGADRSSRNNWIQKCIA
ncbi:hypothetical protein PENTCL1PPCAC_392, partial [Pristionchus entomophagus]